VNFLIVSIAQLKYSGKNKGDGFIFLIPLLLFDITSDRFLLVQYIPIPLEVHDRATSQI